MMQGRDSQPRSALSEVQVLRHHSGHLEINRVKHDGVVLPTVNFGLTAGLHWLLERGQRDGSWEHGGQPWFTPG